ncbi:MAG TPA: replication initiator, partial [Propionibacteriaceae bacterium]|nr:replication initiator [Propionibacteriaceae bacterium]
MTLAVLAQITTEMAQEMAVNSGVCIRPVMKRVYDRDTSSESRIPIACGSTRKAVCPPCARRARVLRIQQCAEGWHRDTEPDPTDPHDNLDQAADEDQADGSEGSRRVRSTKRRTDAANLPQVPMANRTVGRTFHTSDGKEYRPSMFLTLTLPSYGPIRSGTGVPVDSDSYDYRRAALDALHFPKLVDRFWQNLRRCAGYRVQYFAVVEPQARLAPHLHTAMRGVIPRAVLKQVIQATYVQIWWPSFDRPVYVHRRPVWTGDGYCDPDTGVMLPTWTDALDELQADPDAQPAHVMRFGAQYDLAGIIAPSPAADRAVRYLAKYLTKAIADPLGDRDSTPGREAHIDRLHDELRWVPCSPRCANWLRYGIQPDHPGPGLVAGRCASKAHDHEHLGCGGRRVLVSRDWSGKTLAKHRADRAAVVRQALDAAGMLTPDVERM